MSLDKSVSEEPIDTYEMGKIADLIGDDEPGCILTILDMGYRLLDETYHVISSQVKKIFKKN